MVDREVEIIIFFSLVNAISINYYKIFKQMKNSTKLSFINVLKVSLTFFIPFGILLETTFISSSAPSNKPNSSAPTVSPSGKPSNSTPTVSPSGKPSSLTPTVSPSGKPSSSTPTVSPSDKPSTPAPTVSPSDKPSTPTATVSPSVKPSNSSLILGKGKWWKNTKTGERLKAIVFTKKDKEFVVYFHNENGSVNPYTYDVILGTYPKSNIIPIDFAPVDSPKLIYHTIFQLDNYENPQKLKISLRKQPHGRKRPEEFVSEQEVSFEVSQREVE
jgi:hypothetical protein